MNIGIVIGRIGDVDGVGLETEKWIQTLEQMGHETYILSGMFKGAIVPPERQTLLPLLSFSSPECEWEQNRAFFLPPDDPDELLSHIDRTAHHIASEILAGYCATGSTSYSPKMPRLCLATCPWGLA